MALHTKLSVYTAASKLLDVVTEGTFHMRKDAKPGLGQMLTKECLEIIIDIRDANIATDKVPHLDSVLRRNCRVEELLKVAVNRAKFSPGAYAAASELTVELGERAGGWRNWSKKKQQERQLHGRQGSHDSA